jgi:hypothetical protein
MRVVYPDLSGLKKNLIFMWPDRDRGRFLIARLHSLVLTKQEMIFLGYLILMGMLLGWIYFKKNIKLIF